jgi:hypothetical protein
VGTAIELLLALQLPIGALVVGLLALALKGRIGREATRAVLVGAVLVSGAWFAYELMPLGVDVVRNVTGI